jgi:hypothetical protein
MCSHPLTAAHNFINNMKYLWLLLCILAQSIWAQSKERARFEIPVGIQWQSTYMNGGWSNYFYPVNVEKNVQGFGLRLGGKVRISKNTYIGFVPAFRYDYIHHNPIINPIPNVFYLNESEHREPIIDFHVGIERRFQRHSIGFGASLHNFKKMFTFDNPQPIFVDMQFKSASFIYSYHFKKGISTEFRFIVTQKAPNVSYLIDRNFMMLNFSAYYDICYIWRKC